MRTFFEAMDRLDVDAALRTIAPVLGYRQLAGTLLRLYKEVMETLKWDNSKTRIRNKAEEP